MKVSKRFAFAACGVGMATSLIGVGVANADPTAPPANAFDRPLHGEGSDTTEEVMNGLSEVVVDGSGNKLLASWNAKSTSGFTTRSAGNTPAGSNCVYQGNPTPNSSYVEGRRANGSGNGARALRDAFTPGGSAVQETAGCLDFARSSSAVSAGNLGNVEVAQIPLANDALAFAIHRVSDIPRQLTAQQVVDAYHCNFGGFNAAGTWKALIPQAGSGTRASWLLAVGLAETDIDTAAELPCVTDQADGGTRGGANPLQEHDLRSLKSNFMAPVSVAQWLTHAQNINGVDLRGNSVMGTVKSATTSELSAALSPNTSFGNLIGTTEDFSAVRTVYNVVPTSILTGGSAQKAQAILAFEDTDPGAGNTSLICLQTALITRYGYINIPTCGDTSTIVNPQP